MRHMQVGPLGIRKSTNRPLSSLIEHFAAVIVRSVVCSCMNYAKTSVLFRIVEVRAELIKSLLFSSTNVTQGHIFIELIHILSDGLFRKKAIFNEHTRNSFVFIFVK